MLNQSIKPIVNQESVFNRFIELVESGYIHSGIQDSARHMAEKLDFPIQRVEDAVLTGYQRKFESYVGLIGQGATYLEKSARRLLEKVTFRESETRLGELEAALEEGKIELQKYI